MTGLTSIPSLNICKQNMLELGMRTWVDSSGQWISSVTVTPHTLAIIPCWHILQLLKMSRLEGSATTLCRKCFRLVVLPLKEKTIKLRVWWHKDAYWWWYVGSKILYVEKEFDYVSSRVCCMLMNMLDRPLILSTIYSIFYDSVLLGVHMCYFNLFKYFVCLTNDM